MLGGSTEWKEIRRKHVSHPFCEVKLHTYKQKDLFQLKAFHSFQLDSLSGICSDLCHFSEHSEYKAC